MTQITITTVYASGQVSRLYLTYARAAQFARDLHHTWQNDAERAGHLAAEDLLPVGFCNEYGQSWNILTGENH